MLPELALVPLLDPLLPLPDDAPDAMLPEVWPAVLPLPPLLLLVPLLPAPLEPLSPLVDDEPDVELLELEPLPKSVPVGGVAELQPTVEATASAATRLIEWMIFIVCLSGADELWQGSARGQAPASRRSHQQYKTSSFCRGLPRGDIDTPQAI